MTGSEDRPGARSTRRSSIRDRIIDAAIAVHGRKPGGTVADIAREAGVSEATIARHFQDEVDLVLACTTRYDETHPIPDAGAWTSIADPVDRLQTALTAMYRYYAENEAMIASGRVGVAIRPEVAPAFRRYAEIEQENRRVVAEAWGHAPDDRSPTSGAIGHALAFETWRSLHHEQGLTDRQSIELMTAFVRSTKQAEP